MLKIGDEVVRRKELEYSQGERGKVVEIGAGRNEGRVRVFWHSSPRPKRTWMATSAVVLSNS